MPRTTKHLKKHQFKPGAPSANPHGRPPLTPAQKALRKLTLQSLQDVIEMALTGNIEELKALAQEPNTPALQVGVATAILRAIKDGDPAVLERFAERIVGKIPDRLHLSGEVDLTVDAQIAIASDAELEERLKRIRSNV